MISRAPSTPGSTAPANFDSVALLFDSDLDNIAWGNNDSSTMAREDSQASTFESLSSPTSMYFLVEVALRGNLTVGDYTLFTSWKTRYRSQ